MNEIKLLEEKVRIWKFLSLRQVYIKHINVPSVKDRNGTLQI